MKIYEPKGRAREYSPLALNYYKGCTHGCKYCYVPSMFRRFNSSYNHECVNASVDFDKIESSAKKWQGCDKQILLSFTGDPYCGVSPNVTSEVLRILNKYGHKVAILTKGGSRVFNDIDVIKSFGDRIKIGATMTFENEKDSLEWESGAATPIDRLLSLERLANEGVKVWVSFEPVISTEQSLSLLRKVADFVDHVKIGKINNYKGIDKQIDWSTFLSDAVDVCRQRNIQFYIKKDLRAFNRGVYLSENEQDCDYLNL